jgi:hypothetical protein
VRAAPRRSSTGRIFAAVVVALLAAGAVVTGVIVLTHGGHSTPAKSSLRSTLASHRTRSATAIRPSAVTVTVLNGTDMQGLGATVLTRLASDGYRRGGAAKNASDQTHTSSLVEYMAPADRSDALSVATALKLGPASVQPIDPTTKAIACPPAQACTSAVVVTVGRDLASQ